MITQFLDVLTGSQHACNYHFMQRNALNLQTVEICPAYVIEQHGSPRNKIRNALLERIYMIKRIGSDVDKFAFTVFGIGTVVNGRHSMPVGTLKLHAVAVGKSIGISRNTHDAMLDDITFFIEKTRNGSRQRYNFRLFFSLHFITVTSRRH